MLTLKIKISGKRIRNLVEALEDIIKKVEKGYCKSDTRSGIEKECNYKYTFQEYTDGVIMSFCRFSSADWSCDLYCYESCMGGITTHVAGNRVVGKVPKVPIITRTSPDRWLAAHKKQMAFLDTAKHKTIGLPLDGQTFNDPTYEKFLDRLFELREMGYNFPDYVIKEVKTYIKNGEKVQEQPLKMK